MRVRVRNAGRIFEGYRWLERRRDAIYRKDRLPAAQGQFAHALALKARHTRKGSRVTQLTVKPPEPDRFTRAINRGSTRAEYLPAACCPDFVVGRGVERGSAGSESVCAPDLGGTVLSAGCSQTPGVLSERPRFVQREGMSVGHGLVGNEIPL